MAIGDAFSAPMGVKNQMYGQPQRVPGYAEGYAQAPGQARPALPPEPYPIGRPTGVVGGPAYYTPPGFQAPPQPTEAFMPTDRMPDPIGQQFMRQMQSPMGQQFQAQYEATQAPMRAREAELRDAERARQDQRFQEMMDRIAELEGQLTAREEAATIPQPEIPTFTPGGPFIPGLPQFDFSQIDFSGIPDYLKNLNIPGLSERIMEGTGREEAPIDIPNGRNFSIASDFLEEEVMPKEDIVFSRMPDDDKIPSRPLIPPRIMPPTPDLASIPIPQAPIEFKRPDVVQPQERFIENLDTAANNIDTRFRQAPVDVTNMGQSLVDSYNAGLDNISSPISREIRQIARDRRTQEFIPIPTIAPVRGMPQLPPMPTITPRMPSMPSPRPSMPNIPRINLSKLGIR